jgi:hypothetical protein
MGIFSHYFTQIVDDVVAIFVLELVDEIPRDVAQPHRRSKRFETKFLPQTAGTKFTPLGTVRAKIVAAPLA